MKYRIVKERNLCNDERFKVQFRLFFIWFPTRLPHEYSYFDSYEQACQAIDWHLEKKERARQRKMKVVERLPYPSGV